MTSLLRHSTTSSSCGCSGASCTPPVPVEVLPPPTAQHHADPAHPQVPLASLRPGQTATVQSTRVDDADAAYLRAMGLRPDATVRVCRLGEPCIIEVLSKGAQSCGACGCRIGLSKDLAQRVMVSP